MRVLALAVALAASSRRRKIGAVLMLQVWIALSINTGPAKPTRRVDILNAWTYNDLEAMRPYSSSWSRLRSKTILRGPSGDSGSPTRIARRSTS